MIIQNVLAGFHNARRKIPTQSDGLGLKESGKTFTLEDDLLEKITEYIFKEPRSPDAKIIIDFLDETNFNQHALGNKSPRDILVPRFYDNKGRLLESGSGVSVFPETPNELYDGLHLITQKKEG